MPQHVIIDGNNLLYAMHAHAPVPTVGRETLVKIIEQWALSGNDDVTLVFDGGVPRGGLAQQMASSRITVRFSAPETADDVIVRMVSAAPHPASIRVVTGDKAIRREARYRRCGDTDAVSFVRELYPDPRASAPPSGKSPAEKPRNVSPQETQEWLETFGLSGDDDTFDGQDAMHP